jgi:hypothetical protein
MSDSSIQAKLGAVRELLRLFRAERIAYLMVAVASVLMMLYCAFQVLQKDSADPSALVGLFGSGGLISLGMARMLTMWTQALRLVAGEGLSG